MLSFLSSAKNEISSAIFIFTNFSISQLIVINSFYQQFYFVIFYVSVIIPYLEKFQKNHHSELLKFPENHLNC